MVENDNCEIKNREDYLKNMFKINDDLKINNNTDYNKQKEALKYALDIRKFEIDLYWKRATYFWAFIAASYTGYFALLNKNDKVLLFIGFLGFLFSYSWYFVNRGSKFWQNNWEKHVDYLENEIIGNLNKTVRFCKKSNFINPIAEYPISVTKINQLLSFIISLSWLFLVFDPLFKICNFRSYGFVKVLAIEMSIFSLLTCIFYNFTGSQISEVAKYGKDIKFVTKNCE